jgi:hypothetical protein
MKYISVCLIILVLFIGGMGLVSAQADETCEPKEVVDSFAIAVAEEDIDGWLDSYQEGECSDDIKAGAEALVEAYRGMNPEQGEGICQPEEPISCNIFSTEAYEQQQTANITDFVFVSPSEAELEYRFSEACAHSGPYGLELTYLVTGDGFAGWGVHWEETPDGLFNASENTNLTMWVRGNEGDEIFQVGIKDQTDTEQKVESRQITVVGDEWTKVTIPLARYFDQVKTNEIVNVNFGFNRDHREGTICIDDVTFE